MKHSIFDQPFSYNRRKIFSDGYHHLTVDGQDWSLPLRERELVGSIVRLWNLPRYLGRRRLKGQVASRHRPVSPMADGYALCRGDGVPGLAEALDVCEAKLATYLAFTEGRGELRESFDPDAYRQEMAKTARDPIRHVPFRHDVEAARALIRPFLQPEAFLVAANYLGVLPVLQAVRIAYSPNDEAEGLISSQMFHMDPEGARQVKVFVAARDVGPENSPLTFVPEAISARALASHDEALLGRRVPDKVMLRHAPKPTWVAHEGPRGTMVFIDTSRCFHYGSRPAPKPRLLLYAQYLDPFCSVFAARKFGGKLAKSYRFYPTDDPVEQHLLAMR